MEVHLETGQDESVPVHGLAPRPCLLPVRDLPNRVQVAQAGRLTGVELTVQKDLVLVEAPMPCQREGQGEDKSYQHLQN